MPSSATAGSVSSLLASLHVLARRFLTLAMLEGRQAGLRLLSMLALALLAAGLAVTGWLGLLAGIVLALVENNIVSWVAALGIAALLSFAGAGGLALMVVRRCAKPLFAATRRQLGPRRNLNTEGGAGSTPLLPHEQEVVDGSMAAYAEYQVARKSVRHRLGSPLIIGGVMVAGIAVGYLGRGRHQTRNQLGTGGPSAWMQILGSAQVLIPLWIALHSALPARASSAPTTALQPDDGGKASAGEHHET